MLRSLALFSLLALLQACSPTLNWREVQLAGGELVAMLPCRPDQATHQQSLAGYEIDLAMQGCEAGSALYAISVAELTVPGSAQPVQAQWQMNLLASLQAQGASRRPYAVPGTAAVQPEPVRLEASGLGAEGQALKVQAVWFVRGTRLYHAALYAEHITPEMSEPFFSGIRLR